jgi:uncharacterized protein (TIGR02996 family)
MHDETAFLLKLLENPADDTARLVYADWLDEQGSEESRTKSQFLRLTVRLLDPERPEGDDDELRQLAAQLDTRWLAVVSRLKVEICGRKPEEPPGRKLIRLAFDVVCDKRWDEMTPTEDAAVRHCETCREKVHYCDTIMDAREHARRGHCVAVDLGITRRAGDVSSLQMMVLGRPSPESLEAERRRNGIDPVSAERERRRREGGGGAGVT